MRYDRSGRARQPQRQRAKRRMLDGIAGASAVSVRRLRSDWTGPCMRVRHVGTNAETDIGFGADDFVNTAALLAFAAGGSLAVSVGYDQYGSGRHATQTSASLQPSIVTNGVLHTDAGRPCLIASSGDASMSIGPAGLMRNVAGASISTVFNLAAGSMLANTSMAFVSTGSSALATRLALMLTPGLTPSAIGVAVRRLDIDGYLAVEGSRNLAQLVGAPTLSTIVMRFSEARVDQWINRSTNIVNAVAQTPGASSDSDPMSSVIFSRSGAPIPAGTKGSEFIFFNHALSESERLHIEANQAAAYGAWPI